MSKRILVVEDDASVRSVVAAALAAAGWQVSEAQDGGEGLARLRAEPGAFDLVISDVSMPSMTGLEMLSAAEPSLGAARVLLLSGYARPAGLPSERAFDFLEQPVQASRLVSRVRELLQ